MGKHKQQPSSRPHSQTEKDDHARNLNPNNEQFWKSRGYPERPRNWETAEPESKHPQQQDK